MGIFYQLLALGSGENIKTKITNFSNILKRIFSDRSRFQNPFNEINGGGSTNNFLEL
jgi:hypothetical protein